MKKDQSEIKNTISEINNTLEGRNLSELQPPETQQFGWSKGLSW